VVKLNGGASKVVAAALTAACVAAGLGGCNDTTLGGKSALKQAEEAGRVARSAGDLRPKESFLDDIRSKSQEQQKAAAEQAASDASKSPTAWQTYFDRKSPLEDLKAAVAELNSAASADLPPSIKSAISEQLGTVTGQQAAQQMLAVQDKVLTLSRMAVALQDQASYVMALAGQADVQEQRSKVQAADTAAVQSEVAAAKANVDKAQATVDDLTKQIADRKAKAAEIYSQTEAAYQAGEQQTGNAAVEAGHKTMEARKQGDALTEEATKLGLQLSEAQSALTMAKIQQTEAESKLKVLESGIASEQKEAQGATGLATTLRTQAKALVDAEAGLKQQQKEFDAKASEIEKDLKEVLTATKAADSAFANAITSWNDAQAKLAALPSREDSPLGTLAHDARTKSLLQLEQAAAKTQAGQANLMAADVAAMRTAAETALSMASDALAGKPRTTPPATGPGNASATYAAAASKEFKAADTLAEQAKNAARAVPPAQWLALSIQSAARWGQGLADNSQEEKTAAQKLAREAMDLNPYLPLNRLAGITGQENATTPAGGAPAGTAPAGGAAGGGAAAPTANTPAPPQDPGAAGGSTPAAPQ
jgi:exonuclease SbcC